MKVKYIKCTLKPEVYPELTPEHREELNTDVPNICEANAVFGHTQGVIKGMLIGSLAAFTGCAIGIVLHERKNKKKLNQENQKKD